MKKVLLIALLVGLWSCDTETKHDFKMNLATELEQDFLRCATNAVKHTLADSLLYYYGQMDYNLKVRAMILK